MTPTRASSTVPSPTTSARSRSSWPLPPGVRPDQSLRRNLATLHAAKGIDAFQADNLNGATASFRSSLDWNPYSRDIRYNLCQALYIQASRLKEQETSAAELNTLYDEILKEAAKVRDADPANPNLLLILGYSHRNLGDESRAASAFAEKDGLSFEIHEVRMDVGTPARSSPASSRTSNETGRSDPVAVHDARPERRPAGQF